jgi:hypothetical protein
MQDIVCHIVGYDWQETGYLSTLKLKYYHLRGGGDGKKIRPCAKDPMQGSCIFFRQALLAALKGNWQTSELLPVELPRLDHSKGCFAAYNVRSMDELSICTTGLRGHIRPDTAHAIGGTAELALRYSIISAFTAGPKH